MHLQLYVRRPSERQVELYHAVALLLRSLEVPDPGLTIALHDMARRLEAIRAEPAEPEERLHDEAFDAGH